MGYQLTMKKNVNTPEDFKREEFCERSQKYFVCKRIYPNKHFALLFSWKVCLGVL